MSASESTISRRFALQFMSCGFGYLATKCLAQSEARAAIANPLLPKTPHFAPRAKRVIFIFMQGGPSHVDTFDYKPRLAKDDGRLLEFDDARTLAKTRQISKHRVFKSPWAFKQYGQCGQHVSELFPHVARHVDDLCFLKGMHTNGVAHGPSTLFLHTGSINLIRPSLGSWLLYGLGSENDNLPGFVSIQPSLGNGGPRNYSNAFLPAVYQGTPVGRAGLPATTARIENLSNPSVSPAVQQEHSELLRAINHEQLRQRPGDQELEAVINSYELAWRMQQHAPQVLDLSNETARTRVVRYRREGYRRFWAAMSHGKTIGRSRCPIHPSHLRRQHKQSPLGSTFQLADARDSCV